MIQLVPTHVATLIVDPATPFLTEAHAVRAATLLPGAQPPIWLAPGIALDLPFAPLLASDNRAPDDKALAESIRAALAAPIDVVIQPAAGRRKTLLLADMDSTLIAQETIDELGAALGLRDEIAAITARSMAGVVAFEPSLRDRVALLRGLSVNAALRVFRETITYTPGARTLVQTMRAHEATTALASGGFTLFSALVAEALGLDSHFANTLVTDDGVLTGAMEEPVLGPDAKRRILQGLRYAHGLAPSETLAVGDGANDLGMIAEAGLGIAFRAQAAVSAAADARIDHGDLTALLYLQGFSQAAFVA